MPTPTLSGVIDAEVEIKPETINLKSKGKCKAFIEISLPYAEDNIVTSTVVCQGARAIDGRVDSNSGGRYVAYFNVQDLEVSINSEGEERVFIVTGQLMDGTKFEGSDTVNVKGK